MRKANAWKYLLYGLLVIYIAYISINMSHLANQMLFMNDYPVRTSKETREVRARVHELQNILPGLLSNPNVSYKQVMDILERQAKIQNEAMREIKASFKGDSSLVDALIKRYEVMREVRKNLVLKMQNNANYNVAMASFRSEIEPVMNSIDESLNAISQSSDNLAASIIEDMDKRMDLTIMFSIVVGGIIVIMFMFADKREQAKNREIAYREGLFNQLSQNVDEVFIITKNGEKFNYVSPNSQRLMNLPAEEIEKSAKVLYEFFPREDAEWLKKMLNSESELNGAVERDAQIESLEKFFKIRIYPFKLSTNQVERAIVAISDQTASLRHQQALNVALENAYAASAAKSSFLSHMSHEIRTPMNAIIGMTTIALSRTDDEERVKDCLVKISESSRHLLGLINDILDMSKIESGKMSINHEEFNLNRSIRNINNLVRPQTQARSQNFDIFLENVDEEELIGDSLRLNQVLLNILSNAIKFTPAGGQITLKIQQGKKQRASVNLRFIISDTGIGMGKDFLQKLYLPFEQASASTTAKYGGTGLGMPITANLITLMGGSISVESELGKGTTFTIELPFGLVANASNRRDTLPPLKVLIVDDDHGTCEHASLLLEKMGLQPTWVTSGKQAVDMVREAHDAGDNFDICLIDWKMPEMDGAETARKIRDVAGDDLLIIIISAYDWAPIEEEARKAGVTDFIAKPFFASSLYDTLLSATHRMEKDSMRPRKPEKKEYNFAGKRILLVEDNEFNREIGQEFLEMANAEVEFAENGEDAVNTFLKSQPGYYDLVLMDVQMPVKDGYEATMEIRASDHPQAKSIPILAMTANAFSEDVAHAVTSGMNGHIAKPIDIHELYHLLDAHLHPGNNTAATSFKMPEPEEEDKRQ